MRKLVEQSFKRIRYRDPGLVDKETHIVRFWCDEHDDVQEKAFPKLFAENPDWGTGYPLRDGIGFSSALLDGPPRTILECESKEAGCKQQKRCYDTNTQ